MTPEEKAAAKRKLANTLIGVDENHEWPVDRVSDENIAKAFADMKARWAREEAERARIQEEARRKAEEAKRPTFKAGWFTSWDSARGCQVTRWRAEDGSLSATDPRGYRYQSTPLGVIG